jgi:hypothetical protein
MGLFSDMLAVFRGCSCLSCAVHGYFPLRTGSQSFSCVCRQVVVAAAKDRCIILAAPWQQPFWSSC